MDKLANLLDMPTPPGPRTPDMLRRVNELISESLVNGGRAEPVAFFCECVDPSCYRTVWLTPAAFEEEERDPEWRAVASEHGATAARARDDGE
jgi:hypothetical protein